jgi:hypothetical protein
MAMKQAVYVVAASLTLGGICAPPPLLSHEIVNTTVTFDKEIVRILNRKCIACHSENNLGIPLTSYEQTRPWARAIEEEVLRRHMPPWRAVPGYSQFVNDVGLTSRELHTLVAWIEGNGPKSKDERLIVNLDQRKTPEQERLRPDFAKWQLGTPDLFRTVDATPIAPGRPDEVQRVTVDLGLSADRWIRALEFKPGDRRVVRAAFFSLQETGQWLGSWTPWYGVTTLPADVAYLAPAGSHVVAEIHYRSARQPVDGRGTLGLYFAPRPAKQSPADLVLEAGREPTSNATSQKFHASVTLPAAVNVLAFKPDVEPRIASVEVSARRPDGRIQVLLLLRDILPQWPTPYILREPLRLPKDTTLSVTAYHNTSEATSPAAGFTLTVSLYNADAPAETTP